jgi:hypothetical protein
MLATSISASRNSEIVDASAAANPANLCDWTKILEFSRGIQPVGNPSRDCFFPEPRQRCQAEFSAFQKSQLSGDLE